MSMNNSQKGSITLFVLVAVLFFLIATISAVFYSNDTKTAQIKQIEEIQKEYNPNFEVMEREYQTSVKNTITTILYRKSNLNQQYNINEWSKEDLLLFLYFPKESTIQKYKIKTEGQNEWKEYT